VGLVELDPYAVATLKLNGEEFGLWRNDAVHEADLRNWKPPEACYSADLLAGGVPCPPFSIAGKQLGRDDDRDLFPALLDLAEELQPRAVVIENVRGLLGSKFADYRQHVIDRLTSMPGGGYRVWWKLLEAHDFGVPQLRPRAVLVALRPRDAAFFIPPQGGLSASAPTVGEALVSTMSQRGWEGATAWAAAADRIAPTIVGGSKKHGGPDLGPTRARREWAALGVDGLGLANELPGPGFAGIPKLTVQQAAIIQGFPEWWQLAGRKTHAYRQVGNAFPPPVAQAVGTAILNAWAAAAKAIPPAGEVPATRATTAA
jgi:DNA (cytosine-5)-methyltransferase 1